MNWFKQLFGGPAASDPGVEAGTEAWIAQARILLEKFLLTQVKEGSGRYPADDPRQMELTQIPIHLRLRL